MKSILTVLFSFIFLASGFSQTRNVVVGTNDVIVQPTNFWSANASNGRTGLGLGSAATNPASAFQPSSTVLSNLSSSNGGSLTNLNASNIVGVIPSSNIPSVTLTNITGTLAITAGGTGATNAGGARTNLGLGVTNIVTFQVVNANEFGSTNYGVMFDIDDTNYINFQKAISFSGNTAASTRTNLGLGWSALTNTNAGTSLVSVNTNGEVVSPTNFWQVAPITTTFIESQPSTNQTTNITAARFLHIHSLAISTVGVTNTIALPTNNVFSGDIALVVHQGPTSSITAIRQAGAATNLITLNKLDEAVEFVYYNNVWQFNHNQAFIEPIYFSDTNASANAAASRTNLGLGATWLTNTNVTDFRTAIGLGATNDVTFNNVTVGSAAITLGQTIGGGIALGGQGSPDIVVIQAGGMSLNLSNYGYGFGTNNPQGAGITRTNLGLPLAALTNTTVTNFQKAIFYTNTAPSNVGGNLGTIAAWIEIVASNGVTYKIPAYTNVP